MSKIPSRSCSMQAGRSLSTHAFITLSICHSVDAEHRCATTRVATRRQQDLGRPSNLTGFAQTVTSESALDDGAGLHHQVYPLTVRITQHAQIAKRIAIDNDQIGDEPLGYSPDVIVHT